MPSRRYYKKQKLTFPFCWDTPYFIVYFSFACCFYNSFLSNSLSCKIKVVITFLNVFMYLFLEREEGREEYRERNINMWLPLTCPPSGDLACNPGMCPDWELNWQPFGSQPKLNPLSHTSQGCKILKHTKKLQ